MIIKVTYPITEKEEVEFLVVEEGLVRLGEIIVVENAEVHMKYAVVTKLNVISNKVTNEKQIKVASQLDRILFWLDFENKLLHNGVKLNKGSLEKYRLTGSNSNLTDDEINAKMTRNMLLVHHPYRITIAKNGNLVFNYGALRLTYGKGSIYNVINKCEVPRGWVKDWHKHWYYSKILGVELS